MRTDGTDRPDQHKIYYLREWTDPEINDKILTCGMFYKKTEHMFAKTIKVCYNLRKDRIIQ